MKGEKKKEMYSVEISSMTYNSSKFSFTLEYFILLMDQLEVIKVHLLLTLGYLGIHVWLSKLFHIISEILDIILFSQKFSFKRLMNITWLLITLLLISSV